MKLYTKLMMALEMDERDSSIIQFTNVLAKHYRPDSLYGVHVVPKFDEYYTSFIQEHWAEFLEKKMSLDEVLKKELETKVDNYFEPDQFVQVSCEVLEGKPFKQLIHWADIKNIDLLIVEVNRQKKTWACPPKMLLGGLVDRFWLFQKILMTK